MSKLPIDLAMTRFAHNLQTGLLPDQVWMVITWIAFFFKLVSLAFVGPLIGLVIFDFCLWIYRLHQPQPQTASRTNRISRKVTGRSANPTSPGNDIGSATALAPNSTTSQRRTVYSGQASG
ncbi:uncharacterized protein F4812DRAFT_454656 [Daldinia caldariorum]|uniref:uncharacterized protein n=1 Tax=Daldinia caldariorum TaxID=326644 RepID=UPI002007F508|nr:uncharacterized protein F4812DRAFT_454656 [Daldinia caldariorum]KAI1472838.1 hypothetical protein F4812DRAFT_454656 [Daldinia caldariorum]